MEDQFTRWAAGWAGALSLMLGCGCFLAPPQTNQFAVDSRWSTPPTARSLQPADGAASGVAQVAYRGPDQRPEEAPRPRPVEPPPPAPGPLGVGGRAVPADPRALAGEPHGPAGEPHAVPVPLLPPSPHVHPPHPVHHKRDEFNTVSGVPVVPYPPEPYYDQVSAMRQQWAGAADRIQLLTAKLQQAEKVLHDRDQALVEGARETHDAQQEIDRTRKEIERWKKDVLSLRGRVHALEKENRDTLEMVIRTIERMMQEKQAPRGELVPAPKKEEDLPPLP